MISHNIFKKHTIQGPKNANKHDDCNQKMYHDSKNMTWLILPLHKISFSQYNYSINGFNGINGKTATNKLKIVYQN